MYGLSKFKIALVAFIAIFIFMIAVMYTTTKDESKIIQNQKKKIEQEALQKTQEFQSQENINIGEQKLDSIRTDLDNLTKRIDNIQNSSGDLKCRIQGIYINGQIEPFSSEASLQEAKVNGDEIALICRF